MSIQRCMILISVVLAMSSLVLCQEPGTASLKAPNSMARSEGEKRILAVLEHMVEANETYLSVPPEDGKALRLLTEAADAKNVVEIGTSTGYSGLWFCMALESTGGRLITFEIDHERAVRARQHFKEAGVDKMVTVIEGDAHQQVEKLREPIDVAFIDADKDGYVDYLEKLLPLVRPGGLIFAHNLDMIPAYIAKLRANPELETIFYMQGAGLGITLKKR